MKLEEIGFYTLSDFRAQTASIHSDLKRCELILTPKCNFKCPYCRGLRTDCSKEISSEKAKYIIDLWTRDFLENIRFSGGEPTLYPNLVDLVKHCYKRHIRRIAISTNGSAELGLYFDLIRAGANDFSISLDGGCCAIGDKMAGVVGSWEKVTKTISILSRYTYVTVGMVFTEENVSTSIESVKFADSLGVSDIRIIPSTQYNKALTILHDLPPELIDKYPILKYRIHNMEAGKHIRGMRESDCNRCYLMLDDMAVAGDWHFPCIIYMREHGLPVGKIGRFMREERSQWIAEHNTFKDPICRSNCLDVCIAYNNKVMEYRQCYSKP